MSLLRDQIFSRYHAIHGAHVDTDDQVRQAWFLQLVKYNYLPYLPHETESVLEIGCGKGHMAYALNQYGISKITGIDLSAEDLLVARERTSGTFLQASVLDFLPTQLECYNLIVTKDVMEHIEFDRLAEFVKHIYAALKPGGVAMIQVPNMDWLLAAHERYMDLTHTVGFTRESLGQICRLTFGEQVAIYPVLYDFPGRTLKSRIRTLLLRPLFIKLTRAYLSILGSGLGACWFEHREIIAVCKK